MHFLLTANQEQTVDGALAGNKTRFINNAAEKYANCVAKLLLCNQITRVALFAKHDVKAGTELFFDYLYPKDKTDLFKQPDQFQQPDTTKVVAVKQKAKRIPKASPSVLKAASSVEERTAKARAAKLAKMLALKAQQLPRSSASIGEGTRQNVVSYNRSSNIVTAEMAPRTAPAQDTRVGGFPRRAARKTARIEIPLEDVGSRVSSTGNASEGPNFGEKRVTKRARVRTTQEKRSTNNTVPSSTAIGHDEHQTTGPRINAARDPSQEIQETDEDVPIEDLNVRPHRSKPDQTSVMAIRERTRLVSTQTEPSRAEKRKRRVVLNSDDE